MQGRGHPNTSPPSLPLANFTVRINQSRYTTVGLLRMQGEDWNGCHFALNSTCFVRISIPRCHQAFKSSLRLTKHPVCARGPSKARSRIPLYAALLGSGCNGISLRSASDPWVRPVTQEPHSFFFFFRGNVLCRTL